MKKFTDLIKEYEDFTALGGVDNDSIEKAEIRLGLKFNDEYKEFLREYGAACANAHEFFGICRFKRLDIVEETLKAREENSNVPKNLYCIEDIRIDKIKTWQDESGKLFQTVGNGLPEKIELTLCKYVET